MKRTLSYLCLLFAIVFTVLSGALYAEVQRRKSKNEERVNVTQRLEALPKDVGDWKLRKTVELPESVCKQLEDPGYVYRAYVNESTGERVSVIVLVGAHGPIAVHTPAVCYPSRNFKIVKTSTLTVKTSGTDSVLWTTEFKSSGPR